MCFVSLKDSPCEDYKEENSTDWGPGGSRGHRLSDRGPFKPTKASASSPSVLALHFTQVTNPSRTPFQIFVFLAYQPVEQGAAGPVKIPLGDVALYPPDRPGGFMVRASGAFPELRAKKATDVRLVLEMKRLHLKRRGRLYRLQRRAQNGAARTRDNSALPNCGPATMMIFECQVTEIHDSRLPLGPGIGRSGVALWAVTHAANKGVDAYGGRVLRLQSRHG